MNTRTMLLSLSLFAPALLTACDYHADTPQHGQGQAHGHENEHAHEHDAADEGRTTIPDEVARAAGVETGIAGPGVIVETLPLYGTVVPDATRTREIGARFPGEIGDVYYGIGDRIEAGAVLATIESNDSLLSYPITAPIAGVITHRHAAPGQQARDQVLFVVTDFSTVWAELDVPVSNRGRVRTGQAVQLTAGDDTGLPGTVAWLAPFSDRASQRVTLRVVLDNTDGRWTPGQFVEGAVTLAETEVDLAVPLAALQTFHDYDVVFARSGETYEARMLELGRRDAEHAEVLGGLTPGTEYVTHNSFLIKADIEKAGASHDH